jgi:phosphoglycerate dehydrogenase-like enzyme
MKSYKNLVFLDNPSNIEISKKMLKLVPTRVDCKSEEVEVIYTHFNRVDYSVYPNLKAVLCPCRGVSHLEGDTKAIIIHLEESDELELFNKAVSSAEWAISNMLRLLQHDDEDIRGKKIGFIGFNRMATQIAYRLSNFGVDMQFFEPESKAIKKEFLAAVPSIKQLTSIALLCTTSDIIFMGLPDMPQYTGFVDELAFANMSKVYFINPFRSKSVVADDLIEAYDNGFVKGFAIDDCSAYTSEVNYKLTVLNVMQPANVIVSQYKAGKGQQSRIATDMIVLDKLEKLLKD